MDLDKFRLAGFSGDTVGQSRLEPNGIGFRWDDERAGKQLRIYHKLSLCHVAAPLLSVTNTCRCL